MRALVLGLGGLLGLIVALPANAAPVENVRFSGTESSIECSRFPVEATFSGRIMTKDATPATDGQFFYGQIQLSFRNVITNPANGKWMVVRGHSMTKEVQARQVEDSSVFTFVLHEAGQPMVVEDMFGRVVQRNRGLISSSIVFDTLGDSTPGGNELADEVLRVSGPHPDFEGTVDFCALVTSLIG